MTSARGAPPRLSSAELLETNTAIENLPSLRRVIEEAELRAKRSLGQNFILDLNITRKIARAVDYLDRGTTLEVGPGPGGLTRALLLEGAHHLVAIERDSRAIKALEPLVEAAAGRLQVIDGDALDFDYLSLPAPRRIVANLPYNIGTPLLIGWLKDMAAFESLTLMFQREVADRLMAVPRTKAYGRLSVMAQWRCDVRRLFDLPPQAFTPPPDVTSSVVQLTPRLVHEPESPPWDLMERATAAAFSQRRKMLKTTLKPLGNPEDLCARAGVPATARAEELTVEDFVRLARLLLPQTSQNPEKCIKKQY